MKKCQISEIESLELKKILPPNHGGRQVVTKFTIPTNAGFF